MDEKILNDIYQAKAQHLKAVGFSFSFRLVMFSLLAAIYENVAISQA